jgi:hypothetical protein
LSAFFAAVLGSVTYCAIATHRGVAPDSLNPFFWLTFAFAVGYIFFLCSLAKQLGENPLNWALAVIILVPVGLLYTYPRMWFYVSEAKRRLTSTPGIGKAPSWARK